MATRTRSDDFIVTQSLLDRLIGWDAVKPPVQDPPADRRQSIRILKAALRRDLEWLLNTRRNPESASEYGKDLGRSLYNYGLPDFSHASINSPKDRQWLAMEVERTIATFEPRLREVRVRLVENTDDHANRTLSFEIEGMLDMDPAPEHISFDTIRDAINGEFSVRGERGA